MHVWLQYHNHVQRIGLRCLHDPMQVLPTQTDKHNLRMRFRRLRGILEIPQKKTQNQVGRDAMGFFHT